MWTVQLSPQASSFWEQLTGKHQRLVSNALSLLAEDPHQGKMLKGDLRGYWSLRAGNYRIIYTVSLNRVVVEVLHIQHRKEVYEKFRGK